MEKDLKEAKSGGSADVSKNMLYPFLNLSIYLFYVYIRAVLSGNNVFDNFKLTQNVSANLRSFDFKTDVYFFLWCPFHFVEASRQEDGKAAQGSGEETGDGTEEV